MTTPRQIEIRDCVALEKGKPPAQQDYYGADAGTYVTPEYLRGGESGTSVKPGPKAVFIDDGDTILLWDGSNAGEVLRGRPGILASTMSRVSHSERLVPQYFFYALKRWESYLKGQTSGSGIPHIDKEILGRLKILEFGGLEQTRIAEVLSTVDRAIEQTEALIAKQQRIKVGLMQDLLTRGIDEQGNLRSEATHKFKDSPVGRIPTDWSCKRLSWFVPSAEYGISSSLGDYGRPVLRMNNLSGGEADFSDLKYTILPVPERLWLRAGDVLFNRTNSWEHVGRTGIWRGQIEGATFASYLVRLNPDETKLIPEVLSAWLNWQPTQIAMRRIATPAVQQVNINPTNLRAIHAAFPRGLDEQRAIAERLTAARHALAAIRHNLNKLTSLKIGLMQDLLTGNRRVAALLEKE